MKHRVFNFKTIANFRDLGNFDNAEGMKIRPRMIYRSGELSNVSEEEFLKLSEFGIKTVIDLRSGEELEKYPDKLPENTAVYHCPLSTERMNATWEKLCNGHKQTKEERYRYKIAGTRELAFENDDSFKKIFSILMNEKSYPLIFHCAEGKDRTGAAAALILKALDAADKDIIEDYMLTNLDPAMCEKIVPEYIGSLLDSIKKEFGTFGEFAALRFSAEEKQLEKIRQIMLEKS